MSKVTFRQKKAGDVTEFLKSAKAAERYVHSFLKEEPDGICSDEVKGTARHNLYVGTAGILHMYVQFDQILPDEDYRRLIEEQTRFLKGHILDGVCLAKTDGEFVPGMAEAFYSGIGGIGLILNEVYRLYQNPDAKAGAEEILAYYKKHQKKEAEGIFWSGNAPVFFDGGIILFLIDSIQTYGDPDGKIRRMVIEATDDILAHGMYHKDGGLEIDRLCVDFKHKEPNFEFGTAGIGYFFLKVYELTKDERYLQAAKAATVYLKSIAVSQKKGYLIPYKLGKYEDLFYLGNCHGPVGTAKLFYELYQVTGEDTYMQEVFQLVDGAESLGAPFVQSAGFWNTTCVCCGPAGYVPLYEGLYYSTGEEKWKKLCHEVGEVLLGTQTGGYWEIAFDRTRPDELTRPAGYFTGAAGVAATLLQIYSMETGTGKRIRLIDDPYLRS